MSSPEDIEGPYIKWTNMHTDGWQPTSFKTLIEALATPTYGNPYMITKPVKFKIEEINDA